jgi:hypothetical protein
VTTLRRLIFPLFAVCLALAVGVALGTGPLRGSTADGDDGTQENATQSGGDSALTASQQYAEAVAAAAAPGQVSGALNQRAVTVVVLPGVADARVTQLQDMIATAGGTLAATVTVADDYVDPAKKTYVDTVAQQSMESATDLESVAGEETYDRIGALLARAYVGHSGTSTFDEGANKIDSELAGAKLVTVAEPLTLRGTATVVLAPGTHGDGADVDARNIIVGALVKALARQGDGTVLVTPPSGAEPGGLIAASLADPDAEGIRLSTVNVSSGSAAHVAAVLALRNATASQAGNFGIVDGKPTPPPPAG